MQSIVNVAPIISCIDSPLHKNGNRCCINLKKQNRREWKWCTRGLRRVYLGTRLIGSSASCIDVLYRLFGMSREHYRPGWLIYKVDKVRDVGCLRVVFVVVVHEVMARQPYLAIVHSLLCIPLCSVSFFEKESDFSDYWPDLFLQTYRWKPNARLTIGHVILPFIGVDSQRGRWYVNWDTVYYKIIRGE